MSASTWTEADTAKALEIWADCQRQHDVSGMIRKTAGVDPLSGQLRFGDSATDIWEQMEAKGIDTPLYYTRVGSDYYVRKGAAHISGQV